EGIRPGVDALACSGRAHGREARNRHAPPALANLVAIEAVGAVRERNSACRIGPPDLPARAAVPEGARRVGLPEAAEVSHAVLARDHYAQGAVHLVSEIGIGVVAGARTQRLAQCLRLPQRPSIAVAVV